MCIICRYWLNLPLFRDFLNLIDIRRFQSRINLSLIKFINKFNTYRQIPKCCCLHLNFCYGCYENRFSGQCQCILIALMMGWLPVWGVTRVEGSGVPRPARSRPAPLDVRLYSKPDLATLDARTPGKHAFSAATDRNHPTTFEVYVRLE